MTQDDAGPTRRTRRRATSPQGAPRTPSVPPVVESPAAAAPVRKPRHKAKAKTAAVAAQPTGRTAQPPARTAQPTGRSAQPAARTASAKSASAKSARRQAPRAKGTDRGLQELVGGGPSQLDPLRALRARDLNRPTDADLAAAERSLQIVRRNWKPQ